MGRPYLTVAMRDLWLLAGAAVEAGRLEQAQEWARQALELSGWDRYRRITPWMGFVWAQCPGLPRSWAYYAVDGSRRLVLVHPDAARFVLHTTSATPMVYAVHAAGPGWIRLGDVLVAALRSAMDAPDEVEGDLRRR